VDRSDDPLASNADPSSLLYGERHILTGSREHRSIGEKASANRFAHRECLARRQRFRSLRFCSASALCITARVTASKASGLCAD